MILHFLLVIELTGGSGPFDSLSFKRGISLYIHNSADVKFRYVRRHATYLDS